MIECINNKKKKNACITDQKGLPAFENLNWQFSYWLIHTIAHDGVKICRPIMRICILKCFIKKFGSMVIQGKSNMIQQTGWHELMKRIQDNDFYHYSKLEHVPTRFVVM